GRVIARGDARSLKRQVGGDQLHVVVVNPDDLDEVGRLVQRCGHSEPTLDRPTRSVTAPTTGGPGAIAELAADLANAGIPVEDLGLRHPTLDDVFLTLTGAPPEAEAEADTDLEKAVA